MRTGTIPNPTVSRLSPFVQRLICLVFAVLFFLVLSSPAMAGITGSPVVEQSSEKSFSLNPSLEATPVFAERTLVITLSTADPCKEVLKEVLKLLPADATSRKFTLKGVSLNGEAFFLTACQKMRKDLEGATKAYLKDISGYSATKKQFNSGIEAIKRDVYVYFLQFVAFKIYDYLPPETQARFAPNSPEAIDEALKWLAKPENQIKTYVHSYLEIKAKPLARLFKDYMSGASMEIISGLKELMSKAKEKFDRFTKMQREIDTKDKDTEVSDILEKYGFGGDYLKKFKEYEGRIKGLNKSFKIKEAVSIIAGSFQTDIPNQKIAGLMELLSLVGGVAEDSNIPIVSLFGQIVKAYGDLGKEMLSKVLALEKMIRGREGFCIGGETHTLIDPQTLAFFDVLSRDYEACPLELDGLFRNVFYQTQPEHNNNQLYFWDGKKFIIGRVGGGGDTGLDQAIRLIREGERLNFASYAGKSKDIPTIAEVYNTPYPKDKPRGKNRSNTSGVMGLKEEAEVVIDTIARQIKTLRNGTDPYGEPACTVDKVDQWIDKESGQSVQQFMDLLEVSSQDLKSSYALAFVEQHSQLKGQGGRRTAAFKTYSRFFDKVELLSVFKIRGWVLNDNHPGQPCPKCAGAKINLSFTNARELPGCKIKQADAKGRFIAHLVSKSSDISAKVSASVDNVHSETFPIEPEKLGLNLKDRPFVKSFNLTLPLKFEEDEPEEGEGEEGPPEGGISAGDIAIQLEVVATQAESAANQLQVSCQALSGIGAVDARLKQLQSGMSGFKSELDAIRKDIEQRDRSVAEIQKRVTEASGLAEKIIGYRKTAEMKAMFACEQAELLQKKQGDPKSLIPKAEAAGREAQSLAGKARSAYTRVRAMADEAGAKSRALSEAGEKIKSLQQKAQKITAQLKAIEAEVEPFTKASDQAAELLQKLPELKARAEGLLAQGRGAEGGAEQAGRLDAAFGRVIAATNRATPCDEKFATQLIALKNEITSAKANFQTLQPQLDSLNRVGASTNAGVLKDSLARINAVADTAEIYSEAVQKMSADAGKCVALARAMVREGPDKLVSTARVAISVCEFKNAKALIKQLGNDPRRAKLEALYFDRVRYEGKTKTLFAQANQLFKDKQLGQALALLKEARAHTQCDKFRGRIDQAIGKIEARLQDEKDEEKPDQAQANASCQTGKSGSVAVWDSAANEYKCRCPGDRVESPDGKSCIDKTVVAGEDTDLEPGEAETFAVAFKIYFLKPKSEPQTLKIPKGADSKTRKRIKKQNVKIIEEFARNLSLSNTRPEAVTKMEVPMMIGFDPAAHETFPQENFAPGDRYSVPVSGNMPGANGASFKKIALLLEVIRSYDSLEEVMAAYPQAKGEKAKGMADPKNMSQAVIRDSSGTFTISDAKSGKFIVGPLTKGWTSANKHKALGLTKAMILMSGTVTCFVATAVYEDPLAKQLMVLRSFRDKVLLSSASGARLVRLYYKYGPGWAEWVKERPSLALPLQSIFDAGVGWLQENELKGTWQGDFVDGAVRTLDTISTWFTDEENYASPADSGDLLKWLGL